MTDFDASRARRARALRAAQVVTLSLSVSGLSLAACGGGEGTPDAARSPDARAATEDAFSEALPDAFAAADAPMPSMDAPDMRDAPGASPDAPGASPDAPGASPDAPISEDAFVFNGDAGCAFPPTDRVCCELYPGGFWDESTMFCAIAVPGPFVPPSMVG